MASRRSRNLFACFPPLDPQRVRRTQCQAPPSWSACRGCWYVTEHDALAMMSGDLVPDTDGEAHRVCYRCPKLRNVIIYNGQMELRRCSVCCRKDRFENHQKCKFDCERRFDSMMRETTEEKRVDQGKFTERYIRAICAGGMRLGLSCHKLESDAMMSMSRELIQIGIDAQLACAREGRASAQDIAPQFSRITLEREVRRAAESEMQTLMKAYQRIQFVNLKIDAGTVLNSHVTHAVLDSPWVDLVPYVLDVVQNCCWDHSNYEAFLVQHLQTLERHDPKLIVCSVVHDNLAVQSNAVDSVLPNWEGFPKIIDVPCLNHMLNLVYKDSVQGCGPLAGLVDRVSKWKSLFDALGLPAPSVPETRWFYIVELIAAIVSSGDLETALQQNSDVAEDILQHKATHAPPEFLLLRDVLEPLYEMSHALERQQTRLSHVIPLTRECFAKWTRIINEARSETFTEIVDALVSNFLARLRSNAFEEILTSYILSVEGKRELRQRLSSQTQPPRCRIAAIRELLQAMDSYPLSFQLFQEEADESGVDTCTSDRDSCDEAVEVSGTSGEEPAHRTPAPLTITQRRRRITASEHWVLSYATLSEKLSCDLLDDALGTATCCLMRYGGLDNASQVNEEHYRVALCQWINLDLDQLTVQFETFSDSKAVDIDLFVWNHICQLARGDTAWRAWMSLSNVAIRFVSAAVSEAQVERVLSKQKLIQGNHMTNVSMEGLTARLQLYGRRAIGDVSEPKQ